MFASLFISLLTVHPCDRVEPAKAGCAQTCEKKGLEPVCKCQSPEYKLAEDNKNCVFVHPCDRGEWNGGCEQTCKKNNKEAYCECNDGFKLSKDGFKCDKLHPCEINNGGCSDECKKIGETCEQVHPCERVEPKNGGCAQQCVPKGDDRVCACTKHKFVLASNGKDCNEVHMCDREDIKACQHICNKKDGQHECSCEEGFRLQSDGKNCVELHPCDKKDNAGCEHKC